MKSDVTVSHPRVVALAQSLVALATVNPDYDSASPGEAAAADWIRSWAEQHGIEHRTDEVLPGRSNVVLTARNGPGHPHVLLVGHTDTVGVDRMTIPPFHPEIRDGRLYGRGSADMKGPLAAMMEAFRSLHENRTDWRGTATLACVVDEEHQARGIKALMKTNAPDFDFAVVGEPTRMRVVRGCKGCLRFSIEATGAAAHSSTPDLGRNAIVAMSEAILVLTDYFEKELAAVRRPGFGSSTGSISLIQGGNGINIVPPLCRVSLDIRLLPGQRWEQVYATVQEKIAQRVARVPGIGWNFGSYLFADPAFETEPDSTLVRAGLRIVGQEQAEIVGFSCDASKIGAAGIPCIILGPGDIAQAHTESESIGIDELIDAVPRYAGLARRLMPPS